MPKGYWIVRLDVTDGERYALYQEFVRPFLQRIGGRYLVSAGRHEVAEGKPRSRQVVVEFETYDAALTAYHSPEYQRGMKLRLDASTADFVIVEGIAD